MIISLFLALVKPHLERGAQLPPSPAAEADAGAGGEGTERGPWALIATQLGPGGALRVSRCSGHSVEV